MSGVGFDVSGMDELFAKLDETKQVVNRGVNKVLKESAKPLKEAIERNTPIGYTGVAKQSVIIGSVKNDGFTKNVDVGYAPNVAWRMWFLEKGTYSKGDPKGIEPQHNVERAMHSAIPQITAVQMAGLRDLVTRQGGG